jgi:hypothetical protein
MLIEKGLNSNEEAAKKLYNEADEISKILATIIIKTKSNNYVF